MEKVAAQSMFHTPEVRCETMFPSQEDGFQQDSFYLQGPVTFRRDDCNLASKEPCSPPPACPTRITGLSGLWLWHRPWSTPALQYRWPEAGPHAHYHNASDCTCFLFWVIPRQALRYFNRTLSIEILKKSIRTHPIPLVTDNEVLHKKHFKRTWVSWSSQESLSRGRRIPNKTALCPFTFPSRLY